MQKEQELIHSICLQCTSMHAHRWIDNPKTQCPWPHLQNRWRHRNPFFITCHKNMVNLRLVGLAAYTMIVHLAKELNSQNAVQRHKEQEEDCHVVHLLARTSTHSHSLVQSTEWVSNSWNKAIVDIGLRPWSGAAQWWVTMSICRALKSIQCFSYSTDWVSNSWKLAGSTQPLTVMPALCYGALSNAAIHPSVPCS